MLCRTVRTASFIYYGKQGKMIIGDPYKFAFIIDLVPYWNEQYNTKNGIFFFCMEGKLFPKEIDTAALDTDIYYFFEYQPSSLVTLPVNIFLFNMDKITAFKQMHNLSYPEILDLSDVNDIIIYENHKCSTLTIEDNHYYFYAVSNGNQVRILGAEIIQKNIKNEIVYDIFDEVFEIVVSRDYIVDIVSKLKTFCDNNIALCSSAPAGAGL